MKKLNLHRKKVFQQSYYTLFPHLKVKLGWKWELESNTLAYYEKVQITLKKRFSAKLLHSIPVFESSTRMKMRIRIKCTSLLWKSLNYTEKGFSAKLLHSIPAFESLTKIKMRIRVKRTSLLWKRSNYIEKGFFSKATPLYSRIWKLN